MVTDTSTFTDTGIRLKSGEELEADIVVTATGLNLQAFGGVAARGRRRRRQAAGDHGLQEA